MHVIGVDENAIVAIGIGVEVDRNAVVVGGIPIGAAFAPASHDSVTIDGRLWQIAGASIPRVADTAAATACRSKVMLESVRNE